MGWLKHVSIFDCFSDGIVLKQDNNSYFCSYIRYDYYKVYFGGYSFNIILLHYLFLFGWIMIISGNFAFILNILQFYYNFKHKELKFVLVGHLITFVSILSLISEWGLFILFIIDFDKRTTIGKGRDYPGTLRITTDPTINLILLFLMVIGILSLIIANYKNYEPRNSIPTGNHQILPLNITNYKDCDPKNSILKDNQKLYINNLSKSRSNNVEYTIIQLTLEELENTNL